MQIKRIKQVIGFLLVALSPVSTAQICNDGITQNAFTERYSVDLSTPEVATDNATGLEWRRCPIGWVFNGNIPEGGTEIDTDITTHSCEQPEENTDDDADNNINITFTWFEAIEQAEALGDGWRLPNIKELTSLIELGCTNPAINTNIFANFTGTNRWSSTPSALNAFEVWAINYATGTTDTISKGGFLPVLLVRD